MGAEHNVRQAEEAGSRMTAVEEEELYKVAHLELVSMLNYVIQVHVASCLQVTSSIPHSHK